MVARGELKEHISTILAKEVGNLDDLSAKKVREGVEAAMGLAADALKSQRVWIGDLIDEVLAELSGAPAVYNGVVAHGGL